MPQSAQTLVPLWMRSQTTPCTSPTVASSPSPSQPLLLHHHGDVQTLKAMAIRRAALHISSVAMLIRRAALHISSVAMLNRRAALHTSSVAKLIRRAALHISSVKMAYLQSIRRTSTCSKSNISQRRRNR